MTSERSQTAGALVPTSREGEVRRIAEEEDLLGFRKPPCLVAYYRPKAAMFQVVLAEKTGRDRIDFKIPDRSVETLFHERLMARTLEHVPVSPTQRRRLNDLWTGAQGLVPSNFVINLSIRDCDVPLRLPILGRTHDRFTLRSLPSRFPKTSRCPTFLESHAEFTDQSGHLSSHSPDPSSNLRLLAALTSTPLSTPEVTMWSRWRDHGCLNPALSASNLDDALHGFFGIPSEPISPRAVPSVQRVVIRTTTTTTRPTSGTFGTVHRSSRSPRPVPSVVPSSLGQYQMKLLVNGAIAENLNCPIHLCPLSEGREFWVPVCHHIVTISPTDPPDPPRTCVVCRHTQPCYTRYVREAQ